ncbi:MAG: hypothetical protein ACFFAU_09505 [Candidatus Hodarchaeota archaeon]
MFPFLRAFLEVEKMVVGLAFVIRAISAMEVVLAVKHNNYGSLIDYSARFRKIGRN